MEHIINAENQTLGRLASKIAVILQGKLTAAYNPRLLGKDKVIVENVAKLTVTGRKFNDKIYYHHTGYMGHLREKTFQDIFTKSPATVLRKAVYNMLPKNRLRAQRLKRLKIK